MLSIYDEALIRFFMQLMWYGKPVPVVVAGPDRAHAQMQRWLKANRGINTRLSAGEYPTPYPYIAVDREIFKLDRTMYNPAMLRNWANLPDRGYGFVVRKPLPVTAGVDVNIYCNDKVQAEFLQMQLYNLFPYGNVNWIPVDYGDTKWYQPPNDALEFAKILGKQKLQFDLDNAVDSSILERTSLEQKEIRMTLSCTLHGLIPFQPYAVPLVQTLEFEVVDETSEDRMILVTKEIE